MLGTSPTSQTITRSTPGPRPLSFPQERMFLLDRIMPGLAAYNVPTVVECSTHLDAELLRAAFDLVVSRHEILRTKIALHDGEPMQEVLAHRPFELQVVDLRSLPQDERAAEAEAVLARAAQEPFDLEGDVLLRAALVHEAEQRDLLLVVFHHVASDFLSSALLFNELDEAYTALREGREPQLPELPIQYADYAVWQRGQLAGERLEELLSYWRDRLDGAPDRLELPTDRPRPNVMSYRGALHELTLPAELGVSLRAVARREGVTMFMLLLAAFQTLLHRYSGSEDLVVGTPVSGRHHEEVSSLLGFFSNTLALRTDLSGDPTFAELLTRVRETAIEAQMYQELPFEQLVAALNPERAQSHAPIFQVLLGYDRGPAGPPTLAGAELRQLPVPGWGWSRFDLSIVLRERPDGSLTAYLEYSSDLFDARRIERLGAHFRTLLEAVAADPQQRLSELPLLTAAERRLMLIDWNDTAREYDVRCLHELFAEQAARTPDSVAVQSVEGRITYGELDRRSNQLARELSSLGIGPGTVAAISAERGIDMMVSLLGILKCGGAYVPIDPSYPPHRQELMLSDSGALVLVTQEHFAGTFDAGSARVLCIDRDWDRIAAQEASALPSVSTPEHLAYVIYTSGSTGVPKGVEISHAALVNLLQAMREAPGLGPDDVLLAVTTLSFDIAGLELFLPLLVGARVVITPLEATMDGVDLTDWLARSGATFMQATPTTWQLMVEAGWTGSGALRIACGGEALSPALADRLLDRCLELWQMYGPTETTIWSSVIRLQRTSGPQPLGGPIANTSFYVLDRSGQPVPIGVPGELYIGGLGLARGYHGKPELTAERFVRDPFSGVPGARLYRTGDLVRWREDATLEFLGRIDQQIKLRGFRIELGEIEAAIEGCEGVATAVAIVREDTPGDQRIVAYVVGDDHAAPDLDAIRRTLRTSLPPYMVPSTFVPLDALPLTANGKLDRRALPAPDGSRPELERSYAAPETPIEQALASIWSEVLAIDRVGLDDDFFDLGGHSLLAVRMLALVQDRVGIELRLGRVFECPTVRQLAAAVTLELLGDDDDELASLLAEIEVTGDAS